MEGETFSSKSDMDLKGIAGAAVEMLIITSARPRSSSGCILYKKLMVSAAARIGIRAIENWC